MNGFFKRMFGLNKILKTIKIIFNPLYLFKRIWNKLINRIMMKLFWK